MIEFEFEKRSQRYRWKDSKKYVSQSVVNQLKEKAIAQSVSRAETITQQMLEGNITVDAWEKEFMGAIKTRTVQLYQLGKPGQLDATDRGKLGSQIRFQYDKLWYFRQAIVNGKLSDAQIKYRANLYLNKTRMAYEQGKERSHYQAGYIWERRMKPALESCTPCIGYAGASWQPIGTLPAPTQNCTCQSNCKCYKVYSDSITKPEDSVQSVLQQLQWSWMVKQENMKITFQTPDIEAPTEILDNAIAQAQTAFNQAMAEVEKNVVEKSPMNFGHPDTEQLEKINKLRPLGAPEYKATELYTVAYVASNNFVWHYPNVSAWSPNALQNMADQYVNRPMTMDHDWWNTSLTKGLIYDAEVRKSDRVSESIISRANREVNLNIFQQHGYQELILYVMYEAKNSIVNDIRFRRMGDVSTGGIIDINSHKCPHDGSYFGEGEDSFTCAKGHKMPHPLLIDWFYDDDELENLASYYTIDIVTDSIELSHVLVGNLPAASLVTVISNQ